MWFIFGGLSASIFIIYSIYTRINSSWTGEVATVGEYQYQFRFLKNKYRTTALLVSVEAPEGLDFILNKETALDRLFKSIGLSQEYQSGGEEFDQSIYIVSDDEIFAGLLKQNETLRDTILKIFTFGDFYGFTVKYLKCHAGRLWIRYSPPVGYEDQTLETLVNNVVPLLAVFSKTLLRVPVSKTRSWKDPFKIKAAILLGISSGLAINGAVHLGRLMFSNVPFTVDTGLLWKDAFTLGLAVTGVMILIAIVLLGRSSRTHLIVIELLLFGGFGAVASSFSELRDINMEFDNGAKQEIVAVIIEKRMKRGRRGRRSYYVTVDDWVKQGDNRELKVGSYLYGTVQSGNKLSLIQRPGYLNYRWIASYKKYTTPVEGLFK